MVIRKDQGYQEMRAKVHKFVLVKWIGSGEFIFNSVTVLKMYCILEVYWESRCKTFSSHTHKHIHTQEQLEEKMIHVLNGLNFWFTLECVHMADIMFYILNVYILVNYTSIKLGKIEKKKIQRFYCNVTFIWHQHQKHMDNVSDNGKISKACNMDKVASDRCIYSV